MKIYVYIYHICILYNKLGYIHTCTSLYCLPKPTAIPYLFFSCLVRRSSDMKKKGMKVGPTKTVMRTVETFRNFVCAAVT